MENLARDLAADLTAQLDVIPATRYDDENGTAIVRHLLGQPTPRAKAPVPPPGADALDYSLPVDAAAARSPAKGCPVIVAGPNLGRRAFAETTQRFDAFDSDTVASALDPRLARAWSLDSRVSEKFARLADRRSRLMHDALVIAHRAALRSRRGVVTTDLFGRVNAFDWTRQHRFVIVASCTPVRATIATDTIAFILGVRLMRNLVERGFDVTHVCVDASTSALSDAERFAAVVDNVLKE